MPIRRISLSSNEAQELIPITDRVQAAVTECGLQDGLCTVFCGHTTAGITLNSPLDPATAADLRDELNRIVPTRTDFHHVFDTPTDAPRTSKARWWAIRRPCPSFRASWRWARRKAFSFGNSTVPARGK